MLAFLRWLGLVPAAPLPMPAPQEPPVHASPPRIRVTVDLLRRLAPHAKEPAALADAMTRLMPLYGVDTPARVAAFLAQTGHESAGFSRWVENLNYSAEGLAATWPTRFAARDSGGAKRRDHKGKYIPNPQAEDLARNPRAIANVVYAERMGNGSAASDDGWRFIARGLIGVTGRDNYTRLARDINRPLDSLPAWLETPEGAVESALWFWRRNDCNRFADDGDFEGLTRRINGGVNGLADRRERHAAAVEALSVAA